MVKMFTRPDNSAYPSKIISSDIDNAEIAARLGFNRLRRSGRVIFMDDMASGLAWTISGYPNNGVYTEYHTIKPFTEPCLMHIVGTNVAPAVNLLKIPAIGAEKLGIEFTFCLDTFFLPNLVDTLDIMYNGNNYKIGLRFNTVAQDFEVWDEISGWSALSGVSYISTIGSSGWQNIKLTFNFLTGKYEKLYINRDIYDLKNKGDYSIFYIDSELQIIVTDPSPDTAGVMIDNIIITTDEI